MYVAVLGLIFGQALLFASAALVAYAIVMWLAFLVFVVNFEEPRLQREFPTTTPRTSPASRAGARASARGSHPQKAKDTEGGISLSLLR